MHFFQIGSLKPEYYKGILMKANPQLHSVIAEYIQHKLPSSAKILDMGAGEGALSLRLYDLGYQMMAIDQNQINFKLKSIPFQQINFNSKHELAEFIRQNDSAFDAVISVETIEHLENPWDYLRDLKKLIKSEGLLFITTPNIKSWASRFYFLFKGEFLHFSDWDYHNSGHINPITDQELRIISTQLHLKIIHLIDVCEHPFFYISKNIPLMIFSFFNLFLGWFFSKFKQGDILLAVLQKQG